jgi:hypothetical protein
MPGASPVSVRVGSQLHGSRGRDEALTVNNPDQLMQAKRPAAVAAARGPMAVRHRRRNPRARGGDLQLRRNYWLNLFSERKQRRSAPADLCT